MSDDPPTCLARPLAQALVPGREVRAVGSQAASVLHLDDVTSPYDRRARAYDRVVGSRPYNRLLWGTQPDDYRAFAAEGVASAAGPLLEVPCGTAAFTEAAYRATSRECLLVDRSMAMLEVASRRLCGAEGRLPEHIALLQGDLFDLPLQEAHFDSIVLSGALHLFDDLTTVAGALAPLLRSGGQFLASGLTAETTIGTRYLRLLHRAGEVAHPRTEAELRKAVETTDVAISSWRLVGSMVFASWSPRRQ